MTLTTSQNEKVNEAPELNDVVEVPESAEEQESSGGIRWTSMAIWAVVIGVLLMAGWGLLNSTAPRPEVGQPAPEFDLEFFNGYEWQDQPTASLSDMSGKVVVLNFWASWCVECRYEADVLENGAQKFAADDVVFLGVAYADVEPNSLAYMEEFNVSYPHAPDLGTDISDMFEITGVPETFIIGPDGTIAHVHIGPIDQTTLDGVISQLLEEG